MNSLRWNNRWTEKQPRQQMDITETERQAGRRIDRRIDRRIERQLDRQADTQKATETDKGRQYTLQPTNQTSSITTTSLPTNWHPLLKLMSSIAMSLVTALPLQASMYSRNVSGADGNEVGLPPESDSGPNGNGNVGPYMLFL